MNGVTYADALVKARRYEEMMTESVDEFFIEAADYICEAAIEEDVMLDEEVNFDLIVEAVVGLMSDEQLAMENVEDFVMEASIYILNEFKKVKAKKAAEKAEKLAKRAAQSTVAKGAQADDRTSDASKALIHAIKTAKTTGDEKSLEKAREVGKSLHNVRKDPTKEQFAKSVFAGKGRKVDPNKTEATSQVVKDKISRRAARKAEEEAKRARAAAKAAEIAKKSAVEKKEAVKDTVTKNLPAVVNNQNTSLVAKSVQDTAGDSATKGNKFSNAAKAAGNWIKNNPGKAAGIGAGVAAATGGAIYAAKKIADKKRAAAAAKEKANGQEEVKENYEYSEYMDLVEAVIGEFTEEELMQENASEFACEVADYMIEEAVRSYVAKDGKMVETLGSKVANSGVGQFVGKHKKAIGIGAGVAAAGATAAIAAKKIADKKKAAQQNQEEVKENYEYPEYTDLVEAVIGEFMSDEEIMAENANEIAIATADYLIENIDNI